MVSHIDHGEVWKYLLCELVRPLFDHVDSLRGVVFEDLPRRNALDCKEGLHLGDTEIDILWGLSEESEDSHGDGNFI